jgi:hypothetical protein
MNLWNSNVLNITGTEYRKAVRIIRLLVYWRANIPKACESAGCDMNYAGAWWRERKCDVLLQRRGKSVGQIRAFPQDTQKGKWHTDLICKHQF